MSTSWLLLNRKGSGRDSHKKVHKLRGVNKKVVNTQQEEGKKKGRAWSACGQFASISYLILHFPCQAQNLTSTPRPDSFPGTYSEASINVLHMLREGKRLGFQSRVSSDHFSLYFCPRPCTFMMHTVSIYLVVSVPEPLKYTYSLIYSPI